MVKPLNAHQARVAWLEGYTVQSGLSGIKYRIDGNMAVKQVRDGHVQEAAFLPPSGQWFLLA